MAWNDEPAGGVLRMYHIPGCPFSERVELLLDLKGLAHVMADHEIDISMARPDWLLAKTRGTTALPAPHGRRRSGRRGGGSSHAGGVPEVADARLGAGAQERA